jgi:hypothetical protein
LHIKDWLPVVLPALDPWVSSEDIRKGARWGTELASELENTRSGIICVLADNIKEPWLNFEAGALSKTVPNVSVHPFLFGMKPSELTGPLGQFQATVFEKDDVLKMVRALNRETAQAAIPVDRVNRAFETCWRDIEEKVSGVLEATSVPPSTSSPVPSLNDEVTQEELEIMKFISDSNESVHPEELASVTGKHVQRMTFLLEGLEEKGLLERARNYLSGPSWYLGKEGRSWLARNGLL